MHRVVICAAMLTACLLFGEYAVAAGEGPFDQRTMEEWLGQPGVQVLALDVYQPSFALCRQEVSRWKHLHEKYHAKGLSVAIVSVPVNGVCQPLPDGFQPDFSWCDTDGSARKLLGVSSYPQSFMWNWHGDMLMNAGSAKKAGVTMAAYFKAPPGVYVQVADTVPDGASVAKTFGRLLTEHSKLRLIKDPDEIAELHRLTDWAGEGMECGDQCMCMPNQQVSPRYSLRIFNGKQGLTLELFSLDVGCLVGAAAIPPDADMSIARDEAVDTLLMRLMRPMELPLVTTSEEELKGRTFGVVIFHSDPPGADLYIDGNKVGQAPLDVALRQGRHTLLAKKDGCAHMRTDFLVQPARVCKRQLLLTRTTGMIDVTSEPSGAEVMLEGVHIGTTPMKNIQVATGRQPLGIYLRDYEPHKQDVVIVRSEVTRVHARLKKAIKPGVIRVHGSPVTAMVYVNGKNEGTLPFEKEYPPGTYEVKVRDKGYFTFTKTVDLASGAEQRLRVKLKYDYPPTPHEIAGWSLLGGGALFTGLGGIFTSVAYGNASDYRQSVTTANSFKDKVETFDTLAITFYVTGAAMVTAGSLLLILNPGDAYWQKKAAREKNAPGDGKKAPAKPPKKTADVSVFPWIGDGQGGLGAIVRW